MLGWGRRTLDAPQALEESFADEAGLRGSDAEKRYGSRRNVVDLARRAGELQIGEDTVLAPGSPWQRHSVQLGDLRRARLRRERNRAAQRLEQTVAVAPITIAEALSRAERAAADAEASRTVAEEHNAAADALAADRKNLPRFRHGHRFIVLDMLVAALAFVGADTLVLDLSLQLSPGGPVKHWLTACFVAIGLLAYAHGAGWLWAVAVGPWPRRRILRFALVGLVATVLLAPVPAFWLLQEFRNNGISLLASADGVRIANPVFFLPVQVVLMAGALLASVRWFVAGDERRLRREERNLRSRAEQERSRFDQARARADAALREAENAKRAAAAAQSDLAGLRANADADDQVEVEHGPFIASLHDAEYLLALEAARAERARTDQARQDTLDAARAEAVRAEHARETALEMARVERKRKDALAERRARLVRALLGSNRQTLLLAALTTTTTALVLVLFGVSLPLTTFAALAAGLVVAVALLLLSSVRVPRHAPSLDAPTDPMPNLDRRAVTENEAPVEAAASANGRGSSPTENT